MIRELVFPVCPEPRSFFSPKHVRLIVSEISVGKFERRKHGFGSGFLRRIRDSELVQK